MANIGPALDYLRPNEGGFSKDPDDNGNWYNGELLGTNWGISAPVARSHGYTGRMEDLTIEQADAIYQASFWPGLEGLESQPVATKIFDMRVNFGVGGANLQVQQACNQFEGVQIAEDGQWGPQTLAAVNSINPADLMDSLVQIASEHYKTIAANDPKKAKYLPGWLTRAIRVPFGNPGTTAIGLLVLAAVLCVLSSNKSMT